MQINNKKYHQKSVLKRKKSKFSIFDNIIKFFK